MLHDEDENAGRAHWLPSRKGLRSPSIDMIRDSDCQTIGKVHQSHAGAKAFSLPPSGQDRFHMPLLDQKSVDFSLAFSEKEGLEWGLHPLGSWLHAPPRPGRTDLRATA